MGTHDMPRTPGASSGRSVRGKDWTRRELLARSGLAAIGVGGAALLAACTPGGSSSSSQSAAGQKVKGGHIVEAAFGALVTQTFSVGGGAYLLYAEGLVTNLGNGDVAARAAADLPAISADGLSYTFKMRPGQKWSDGQPITVDDVVWTYQKFLLEPGYETVTHIFRTQVRTYMKACEKIDADTVKFTMKQAWAPFLPVVLARPIFPAHLYASQTPAQLAAAVATVGNGIFNPGDIAAGQQMSFKRNDAHFPIATALDSYVYRAYSSVDGILAAMQSGEVDFAPRVFGYQHVAPLKAAGMNVIGVYASGVGLGVGFNLDPAKPASKFFPQSDPRTRQALMYALDRDAMATAIYGGYGKPSKSFIASGSWGSNPNATPQYTFDPAKAASLLDAAGWKVGAGGVREKDGQPLKFGIWFITGDAAQEPVAASLQQQWKKVGADVTLVGQNSQSFFQQQGQTRTFDTMLAQIGSPPDPDVFFHVHSASAAPGGFNAWHYVNPECDRLLDGGASAQDRPTRKTFYDKLQDLLANDLPLAPLFERQDIIAWNPRIQGLEAAMLGGFANSWSRDYIKDVWVKDGK